MSKRRHLPILKAEPERPAQDVEDDDAKRPPWHWVGFGTIAIFAAWLPLAYAAQAVVVRVMTREFGAAATPAEISEKLAAASSAERLRITAILALPNALSFALASFAGGYLVGRFGPKAGGREAAFSGAVTALLAVVIAWGGLSIGYLLTAVVIFLVGVGFAAWGGVWGRRSGKNRPPTDAGPLPCYLPSPMFCLRVPTDPGWARAAVRDLDSVLVDHAHCEMKAATNALSLVVRHPGDLGLVRALTDLASEELDHFRRVVAFIERRGLALGPPPVDHYAAELRKAVSRLPKSPLPPVVDRLLVGALIEARSCERFKLLLEALPESTAQDLRGFYEELFAAEARHYRQYVDLATQAARSAELSEGVQGLEAEVVPRLQKLAEAEGAIVASLTESDLRASVHG
ncbi:tRNA-(ms[2]io[6]A)-hydroxylase [Labilithrix luteola]|uniref:tRNA-(ms[2]io[6]A)-hydroxylase n=1 Tax=Labilithrix luteola TaxID=1391654 RepID=UPI001F0A23EC|nr:tRNA-(ms[2]io[6]A)-hydroxylase [Labilithrix luteola]